MFFKVKHWPLVVSQLRIGREQISARVKTFQRSFPQVTPPVFMKQPWQVIAWKSKEKPCMFSDCALQDMAKFHGRTCKTSRIMPADLATKVQRVWIGGFVRIQAGRFFFWRLYLEFGCSSISRLLFHLRGCTSPLALAFTTNESPLFGLRLRLRLDSELRLRLRKTGTRVSLLCVLLFLVLGWAKTRALLATALHRDDV